MSEVLDRAAKANSATITYVPTGDYQSVDAMISRLSVKTVLPEIPEEVVKTGLNQINLPARYEIVRSVEGYSLPFILIDGAHTANSIKVVIDRMRRDKIFGNLLFSCAYDKHVEEMATILIDSKLFKKIYLTIPGEFKKSDLNRIVNAFSSSNCVEMASRNYKEVIQKALEDSSLEDLPLIVLGSFHLAGEVSKVIKK